MVKQFYPVLIAMVVVPLTLQAEVFRTVDEEGNITYTDSPSANPSEVEKIEIHPGPSEESISEAMERNKAIRKAMEEAREKRLEAQTSGKERLGEAKKEVEEAEKRLSEMQEIGDDDRQTLQGGKSFIKPDYYERVKKAEKELEEARKRYKSLRGY
ncbi:MAG: DUF4124 domain-containing protein [Candidatus Thiodiazotropha sp. 6PLUC2]